MKAKEFEDYLKRKHKEYLSQNILPPPTNAQEAIDILYKHFLGDDYLISDLSLGTEQMNTLIVYEIILNYPGIKENQVIQNKVIKTLFCIIVVLLIVNFI